ncbi:hypothetical protein MJ904_22085 [Massilia sp. MB5]|uniref:hypothetical protein n=1 Tax=Massilia sp. MB5 TaxID=2919578 RepID=UPI001F0D3C4B|nr:hypothetical protein [Massilia sp. MB5]UMR29703.1 hypothetical protein MJ904_22085 [Massilia sp. MB5]
MHWTSPVKYDSGAALPSIPNEALLPAVRATRPDVPLLAVDLLASGDSYYYSHHADRPFPVMRVQFRLADDTSFYIDPDQGTLVGHTDRNGKWNRWLFNGLHQLDFAASLRTRPVWDVMVASLSILGAMLSITGLVLGWRRLSKRRAKTSKR